MAFIASILASFISFIGSVGGVFNAPTVMQSLPPQAAIVQISASPLLSLKPHVNATSSPMSFAVTLTSVQPNLLPTVKISAKPLVVLQAVSQPTSKPAQTENQEQTLPPEIAMNAQSFLNATTLSLNERHDGPYEAQLTTNLGAGQSILWNLSDATVGSSTPFSTSYTCVPEPIPPIALDPDQNPTFTQRTPYTCTISLTPLSGTDLRTQSKQFTFTAPPGKLIVTPPASMDTVLKDTENDGGFVFTNDDTQPITVTNLTFNVAYNDLTNAYGPTILRFINPVTGAPAGDFDISNLPAVSGGSYTNEQDGLSAPVSLTIPPDDERLLPIAILGAHPLSVQSTTPTLSVTLKGVTISAPDVQTVLNSASISWSCTVTFAIYDPNATSGALVSGQACNVGGN